MITFRIPHFSGKLLIKTIPPLALKGDLGSLESSVTEIQDEGQISSSPTKLIDLGSLD